MDFIVFISSILIGIFSGIISGMFGISSAVFIVLFLTLFNLVKDNETAVGTTLLSILPPVTIFAVIYYYKKGKIDIPIALVLSITMFVGAFLGVKASEYISYNHKMIILALIYMSMAGFIFFKLISTKTLKQYDESHKNEKELQNFKFIQNFNGIINLSTP
jgi:uncharacterized membrane protein YfcA